jgi:light-regulated signal transduction histidine kinase (bacteriophytochrome)
VSEASHQVEPTNCDRAQLYQLGAIQPFGFLLVISSDWTIVRASVNLEEFLGVNCKDILGQSLSRIIMSSTLHAIRNRLTLIRGPDMVERLSGLAFADGGPLFDIALHFSNDQIIIEGELPQDGSHGGSTMSIRAIMTRLDQAQTLEGFLREAARQARGITGFDRVMVCRFDDTGSGEVVAEAARPAIGSLLGFHFPASDFPAEARALHTRNIFRIIADVGTAPVPIVPEVDEHG